MGHHDHEEVSLGEFLHLFKWMVEHRKEIEEFMAQVQFTVSITVTAATSPLAEGASSGSASFAVGVQSSVILTPITGGVPPYTVSVDAASPNQLPPGLTAGIDPNNNLIVSGTATAAGTGTVLLDVVDSTGTSIATAAFRR